MNMDCGHDGGDSLVRTYSLSLLARSCCSI